MAGLKSTHIPYQAAPNALSDLLGGEIDFMSYDVTFLMGQARSGRVRILALTSATRMSMLPEVRTMAESGFPGYDLTPWFGVVVPAGTPKPVVDRLAAWFNQISTSEETRRFLENVATDPFPGNSELMAALIKAESENWGKYVRLAKIEPQ
jgi:tripartite-type tricarboxylate transporter receptor subunit TctC